MTYPKVGDEAVPASPAFPQIEERVRAYWKQDGTFQASIDARAADGPDGEIGGNEFVFYDGPPFANGLPHYGHLLTGYVKDVVPRYKTMRGYRVERRFGWDTHGLPAEVEAERQLGIKHKSEIEELGVAAFNEACRTSVLRYTSEWEEYVNRQARWVDFENDYKTLDLDYMESVMWAFKTLWDKGLVYEGFRVLAYCWRCETPLSNTETRMDDVYRQRQDPAVTVGFPLLDGPAAGALAMIWTTTPWTLPSNLAAAVHPDLQYVVVTENESHGARRLLLAADRVAHYARELGLGSLEEAREAGRVVAEFTGLELVGSHYAPPFTFFAGRQNAHQVLAADYVTTDDGTGLVHIAPAFGEEDKLVTDAADIEPVVPVDSRGEFTTEVPPYAGQQVFAANRNVITDLKLAAGGDATRPDYVSDGTYLLRQETYDHPYPHCWRCGEPLIYKAVSSWFVKVTHFRDRMVELNQQITWVPDHIKDGSFGKWLENARDWSISRSRYWGSPIPVWVSDNPKYPRVDVYGSLDELEADFGVRPNDLHRPYVDELTRPNPDDPTGSSTMRRVPEVLDCWFESGSMPFAQVHYPFENADWFEHHYPGDFIVEYIGQTRGWFYTLHVLATALFDRPAFETCVSHGILLGDDGRKMSKSLRNYPDVNDVLDRDGADAMRWFLMSSPVLRGGNLIVTEQGIRDGVRQVLIPLWNVWYFFALYANSAADGDGYEARRRTDSTDVLDRYVLAKTHDLVAVVTQQLDAYDIAGAASTVRDFIDGLTNWYVRRSRDRFWNEDADAFDTLFTVLETLTRVVSPLLPLVGEEIWRGLTGERSVHLTDWPSAQELPADDALVAAMDAARSVCSVALAIRKANGLRVRQPLRTLTIAGDDSAALAPFVELIKDEVNVKAVRLESLATTDFTLLPNARALGPRLGKEVQLVIKAAKAGEFTANHDGTVSVAGHDLREGEFELKPAVKDPQGSRFEASRLIALDTELDEILQAEGWVRDVVRQVQDARKAAGLHVSDTVRLSLVVPQEKYLWADHHRAFIAGETLARELAITPAAEADEDDVTVDVTKLT